LQKKPERKWFSEKRKDKRDKEGSSKLRKKEELEVWPRVFSYTNTLGEALANKVVH